MANTKKPGKPGEISSVSQDPRANRLDGCCAEPWRSKPTSILVESISRENLTKYFFAVLPFEEANFAALHVFDSESDSPLIRESIENVASIGGSSAPRGKRQKLRQKPAIKAIHVCCLVYE